MTELSSNNFIVSILTQLDTKSLDWNKIAAENGLQVPAARMRWTRFMDKQRTEGNQPKKTPSPRKGGAGGRKKKSPESGEADANGKPAAVPEPGKKGGKKRKTMAAPHESDPGSDSDNAAKGKKAKGQKVEKQLAKNEGCSLDELEHKDDAEEDENTEEKDD
ncbi:hypothetical protein EDC01DRAFT_661086 [Geopyxis carbonaria]|nr:hypothetical protein EDC01DRAFT_661086 [Geopyxis carbonaria]